MKARLLENNVKVHLSMDETSPSVGMLNIGTVVELGKVATVNNQPWVEIVDGTYVKGYIKGGTKVFGFHKYSLGQDEVVAFDLPAATGLEKARYKRGAVLEKIDEGEYGLFERFFHKDSFIPEKFRVDDEEKKKKVSRAKVWLNAAAAAKMTPQLLTFIDPAGNVRGWLAEIGSLLEA